MLWLILALVIGVALAGAVIGLVAVPARREGREVLTERAEQAVSSVTDRRRGRKASAATDHKASAGTDRKASAGTDRKASAGTGHNPPADSDQGERAAS